MALDPIIEYDGRVISTGVDLRVEGIGTPNLIARYADWDASGHKTSECYITINYTDISWELNDDNSVTVTGKINGAVLHRTPTGATTVYTRDIRAWFNGNQTFSIDNVSDATAGTYDLNIPDTFSVVVPPESSRAYPAAIHYQNNTHGHSGGAYTDEFAIGILVTNPNPKDHRPGKCKYTSGWLSHNRSAGKCNIRKNGTWEEMRTVPNSTTDSPFIRKNNGWISQEKIGDGA